MSVPDVIINYWAVLGAAIVSFVIGGLWYGPIFGKVWMKEMNFGKKDIEKTKKKGMTWLYLVNFIGGLIFAYVLALFVKYATAQTFVDAFGLGFMIWVGFFAATTLLGNVLWEGKSFKLYLINAGYWLVNLIVASYILTRFG